MKLNKLNDYFFWITVFILALSTEARLKVAASNHDNQPKACDVKSLPDQQQLFKLNIRKLTVNCIPSSREGFCKIIESNVYVECNSDSSIKSGNAKVVCLKTGQWDNIPNCEKERKEYDAKSMEKIITRKLTSSEERSIRDEEANENKVKAPPRKLNFKGDHGCSLKSLPEKDRLEKFNIASIKVDCQPTKLPTHCDDDNSTYTAFCKPGFVTWSGKDHSVKECLRSNLWDDPPRCFKASELEILKSGRKHDDEGEHNHQTTRSTTDEPYVGKDCLARQIANNSQLASKKLVLLDFKCEASKESDRCKNECSFAVYGCSAGNEFKSQKRIFISYCKNAEWEQVPECGKPIPPTKPPKPQFVDSCPLNDLPNKKLLGDRNLNLIDLGCSPSSESKNCHMKDSFAVYSCKSGFRFSNSIKHFTSFCDKDGWDNVPRCQKI